MKTGLIFDIKRFAINDGPGIRLTVFFKGCNLSCKWCHNPESMSPKIQKMYTATKCIGAQSCINNCPNNALQLTSEGIITDFNSCNLCGICADVCPTNAFEILGEEYTFKTLLTKIEKEEAFFKQSGGGVTFSGGEPLLHANFLIEILKLCGKKGYHRVVDTTAFSNLKTILEVGKNCDLFLIDLKVMDENLHRKYTGVSNKKILSNIKNLSAQGIPIIFRMPLIKNVNTTPNNIAQTAKFINKLEGDNKEINLLPYHKIAQQKFTKLGVKNTFIEFETPNESEINKIIKTFESYNIKATVGS